MIPTNNLNEVIASFRRLTRIYHPDKYGCSSDRGFSREKGEKFKIILNPYKDLRNSNILF